MEDRGPSRPRPASLGHENPGSGVRGGSSRLIDELSATAKRALESLEGVVRDAVLHDDQWKSWEDHECLAAIEALPGACFLVVDADDGSVAWSSRQAARLLTGGDGAILNRSIMSFFPARHSSQIAAVLMHNSRLALEGTPPDQPEVFVVDFERRREGRDPQRIWAELDMRWTPSDAAAAAGGGSRRWAVGVLHLFTEDPRGGAGDRAAQACGPPDPADGPEGGPYLALDSRGTVQQPLAWLTAAAATWGAGWPEHVAAFHGRPFVDLVHPGDRERAQRCLRAARGGRAAAEDRCWLRLLGPGGDGDALPFDALLFVPAEAGRVNVCVALYPLREHALLDETLVRSRALLHCVAAFVFHTDALLNILWATEPYLKAAGATGASMLGTSLLSTVHAVDQVTFREAVKACHRKLRNNLRSTAAGDGPSQPITVARQNLVYRRLVQGGRDALVEGRIILLHERSHCTELIFIERPLASTGHVLSGASDALSTSSAGRAPSDSAHRDGPRSPRPRVTGMTAEIAQGFDVAIESISGALHAVLRSANPHAGLVLDALNSSCGVSYSVTGPTHCLTLGVPDGTLLNRGSFSGSGSGDVSGGAELMPPSARAVLEAALEKGHEDVKRGVVPRSHGSVQVPGVRQVGRACTLRLKWALAGDSLSGPAAAVSWQEVRSGARQASGGHAAPEALGGGVGFLDLWLGVEGQVVGATGACGALLGRPLHAVVGSLFLDHVHKGDREHLAQAFTQALLSDEHEAHEARFSPKQPLLAARRPPLGAGDGAETPNVSAATSFCLPAEHSAPGGYPDTGPKKHPSLRELALTAVPRRLSVSSYQGPGSTSTPGSAAESGHGSSPASSTRTSFVQNVQPAAAAAPSAAAAKPLKYLRAVFRRIAAPRGPVPAAAVHLRLEDITRSVRRKMQTHLMNEVLTWSPLPVAIVDEAGKCLQSSEASTASARSAGAPTAGAPVPVGTDPLAAWGVAEALDLAEVREFDVRARRELSVGPGSASETFTFLPGRDTAPWAAVRRTWCRAGGPDKAVLGTVSLVPSPGGLEPAGGFPSHAGGSKAGGPLHSAPGAHAGDSSDGSAQCGSVSVDGSARVGRAVRSMGAPAPVPQPQPPASPSPGSETEVLAVVSQHLFRAVLAGDGQQVNSIVGGLRVMSSGSELLAEAATSSPDPRGSTPPLHFAAACGLTDAVVSIVTAAPRCMNARDASGMTALHHAARAGKVETAMALLMHGADARSANHFGHTAADVAMMNGHQHLAALLSNMWAQLS